MSRKVDIFSQFEDHDHAISAWFAQNGWHVTDRFIDDDLDVFAWHHGPELSKDRRTLRVTLNVLEDTPPSILIEYIDGIELANVLERAPKKYIVIKQNARGAAEVEVLDAALQWPSETSK